METRKQTVWAPVNILDLFEGQGQIHQAPTNYSWSVDSNVIFGFYWCLYHILSCMTNKITNINVKPLETGMAELHNDIRRCRKLTIMAGHYSVLLQTNTQPKN
jgi:hypothetical protein